MRAQRNYRLRPATHEETVQWLRRKLGHVGNDSPPPKRRRKRLLSPEKLDVSELVEGVECGLVYDRRGWRGACTVLGRVLAVRPNVIVLAAWGGTIVTIDRVAIHHAQLVVEHHWEERREAVERQRRGDCGLVGG